MEFDNEINGSGLLTRCSRAVARELLEANKEMR